MVPRIIIDKNIQKKISAHLRRSGNREVGGILLGEQLSPSKFRLVDFSIDSITGSAAHFCRSTEQHSEALEGFFQKTGHDFKRYNYLGEWHSHPRFPVLPSAQDCKSMQDLVRHEEHISFSALLIVRLDWLLFLKANATMFSRYHNPERITLEKE